MIKSAEHHSDSHRFGRRVQRLSNCYFKPRSVALEAAILSPHFQPDWVHEILGYTPNLKVTRCSEWSGEVETALSFPELTYDQFKKNLKNYSYYYGRLLAFCTHLGITDLHQENIIIVKTTADPEPIFVPIPIDLEIALWNSVSGMDTLLYPSRLISWRYCGFFGQFAETASLDSEQPSWHATEVIRGFLDATQVLLKRLDAFVWLEKCLSQEPIRILLRSTHFYRNLLDRISLHPNNKIQELSFPMLAGPLLPEEKLQLDANDIPYFFTYRTHSNPTLNQNLLYFKNSNEIAVAPPLQFEKVLKSATVPISELQSEPRILKLCQTTLLQVIKLSTIEPCAIQSSWGPVQINENSNAISVRHQFFEAYAHVQ